MPYSWDAEWGTRWGLLPSDCTGNFVADPLWALAASGDFTPVAASPIIDVGTGIASSPTTDIVGEVVPQRLSYDVGAYEHPAAYDPISGGYGDPAYVATFRYQVEIDYRANPLTRTINDETFEWVEPILWPRFSFATGVAQAAITGQSYVPYSGWTSGTPEITYATSAGFLFDYGPASGYYYYPPATCLAVSTQSGDLVGLESPSILPIVDENSIGVYLETAAFGGSVNLNIYFHATDGYGVYWMYDRLSRSWTEGAIDLPAYQQTIAINDFRSYGFAVPALGPGYDYWVDLRLFGQEGNLLVKQLVFGEISAESLADFSMPSGYYVQIVPEIGRANILENFDSNINPLIREYGPYSASEIGATRDDGSVEVSITGATQFLSDGLPYLWRAVPVDETGQRVEGGLPARFVFKHLSELELFEAAAFVYDPARSWQALKGTRPKEAAITAAGVDDLRVTYPSDTTWLVEFLSYNTELTITCTTISGVVKTIVIDVVKPDGLPEVLTDVNELDRLGLLFGRPRLPEEANHSYHQRLLNAAKFRTTVRHEGAKHGIATSIGLEPRLAALNFTAVANAELRISDVGIQVITSEMSLEETLPIDPFYWTAITTKAPIEIIEVAWQGNLIESYELTNSNEIQFTQAFDEVTVRYKYAESYLFSSYTTLDTLIAALIATSTSYEAFPQMTLLPGLAGNEPSKGLFPQLVNLDEARTVYWSPVLCQNLMQEAIRDYFVKGDGSLWNTLYHSWVKEIQDKGFIKFANFTFDRDYWDSNPDIDTGFEALPTVFDTPLAWGADSWLYYFYGGVGFDGQALQLYGLKPYELNAGVAGASDLKPGIAYSDFAYQAKFTRKLSHSHSVTGAYSVRKPEYL